MGSLINPVRRAEVRRLLLPAVMVCVTFVALSYGMTSSPSTPIGPSSQDDSPITGRQVEAGLLTAFAADKARRLIRDRYACLGCHELEGDGGRIGPDLTTVADRLTADAIYRMIRQPRSEVPGTVMPPQIMTDDRQNLLTNFLASQGAGGSQGPRAYGSDVAALDDASGPEMYERFCSSCHGVRGDGDGFNAEFLPVSPTAHSDSAYMSTRPDDTLFDGIFAGGRILGKSHRMPGFGQLFTAQQIRRLVSHIRELCNCSGPAWSRDGSGAN